MALGVFLDVLELLLIIVTHVLALPVLLISSLIIAIYQRVKGNHYPAPQTILITGATSGIGKALAIEYAAPGKTLILTGRNEDRLEAVSNVCKKKGSKVVSTTLDVTQKNEFRSWIENMDKQHSIDLVFANAGVSDFMLKKENPQIRPSEVIDSVFDVNVNGVLNTINPLIDPFLARRHGQIAIISSPLSYFPMTSSYPGSKSAVTTLGLGLRCELRSHNVRVNVVGPGFVKSAMTDANDFSMPFIMDAERAAVFIRKGLEDNTAYITFPWISHIGMMFVNSIPHTLRDNVFFLVTLFKRRSTKSHKQSERVSLKRS